jgi:hypothetical protein
VVPAVPATLLVAREYVVRDGALVGAAIRDLHADLTRRARRLWPDA